MERETFACFLCFFVHFTRASRRFLKPAKQRFDRCRRSIIVKLLDRVCGVEEGGEDETEMWRAEVWFTKPVPTYLGWARGEPWARKSGWGCRPSTLHNSDADVAGKRKSFLQISFFICILSGVAPGGGMGSTFRLFVIPPFSFRCKMPRKTPRQCVGPGNWHRQQRSRGLPPETETVLPPGERLSSRWQTYLVSLGTLFVQFSSPCPATNVCVMPVPWTQASRKRAVLPLESCDAARIPGNQTGP